MNVEKFETLIRSQMRRNNIPGLAISAIQNDELIYSAGFGYRDIENEAAMNADTLIGIGSVTKSITAFGALLLQDRGMLNIEDSAAEYLDYPFFRSHPEYTIRHMLSHSSGVPSLDGWRVPYRRALNIVDRIFPAASKSDFIAHMGDASNNIMYKPCERFLYNNDMYTCLGFIIEHVSGLSFSEFVRKEIFNPLEMSRAVFTQSELDDDPEVNVMTAYKRGLSSNGNDVFIETPKQVGKHSQPNGGLYVSTKEMMNYSQCLLHRGSFEGKQILSSEAVDLLFTAQIAMPCAKGEDFHYALGWNVGRKDGIPYEIVKHDGGTVTSSSMLVLVPNLGLAVMAAENSSNGLCVNAVWAYIYTLLGEDPEETIEKYRIEIIVDEVVGVYRTEYGMYEMQIFAEGSALRLRMDTIAGPLDAVLRIKDLASLTFCLYSIYPDEELVMQFFRNPETGKIEHANFSAYVFTRV